MDRLENLDVDMTPQQSLAQRWSTGVASAGVWSCLDDTAAIGLIAHAGFGFVSIDLQHGHADLSTVGSLITAVRASPSSTVVRVPWNRPEDIMRVLDLGAEGVIVPMVGSADQAQDAASACRYAPRGTRSWGPIRGREQRAVLQPTAGDAGATCIVMIETRDGLDAVGEIVAVPGVDAVYIGPNDLSLALGLERRPLRDSPELEAAVLRIVEACRASGTPVGLDCTSPQEALAWRARGMDWSICANDGDLLGGAALAAAAAVNAGV